MTQDIPPTSSRWLAVFDDVVLWQHQDPIGFFEEVKRRGVWRTIWPARLLVIGLVSIFYLSLALFYEDGWLLTRIALFYLYLGFVLVIAATFTIRFWFIYVLSPPLLALSLLCGLAPMTPLLFVLGWVIGMPFALGVLVADALALGWHRLAMSQSSERHRQRAGGPAAKLPPLQQWRRVRLSRLAITGLLIVVAITTLLRLENNLSTLGWSAVLLFAAAGCLHLETTLLAWLGKWQIVSYNAKREAWQTTYIGRHALFVPQRSVAQAITPNPSAADASAALVALLREGCLGPQVRKACAKMQVSYLYPLLLHLSLQEGGAEAIRFLEPALPQTLHHVAQRYAYLANEAAKPFDLQRWIALLPSKPVDPVTATLDDNVSLSLFQAYEALLQYEYTPPVDLAYQNVRNMVQKLYDGADTTTSTLPLSWPVALLKHLEQHRPPL